MLFWFRNWHPQGLLCHLVPYVHISDTQLKVRDVWRDGEWRLEVLATTINEEVRRRLRNVFVWLHDRVEDLLVWQGSQFGKYTVLPGMLSSKRRIYRTIIIVWIIGNGFGSLQQLKNADFSSGW